MNCMIDPLCSQDNLYVEGIESLQDSVGVRIPQHPPLLKDS